MRRSAKVVLWAAVSVLLITIIITSFSHVKWWPLVDDIRWTVTSGTAAFLAWLGLLDGDEDERQYRQWFFLGTLFYFIGQVFWDILPYFGLRGFPNISDAFYLMLGPCCLMGLFTILKLHVDHTKRIATFLDVSVISIAVIGLVLVLYLSQNPSKHWLQTSVLVLYPIGLLSAAGLAILINPFLKLKPNSAILILSAGLLIEGVIWMQWNSHSLNGKPASGSFLNVMFSVADLFIGYGAMRWSCVITDQPRLALLYKRIQRSIPLLAMVVGIVILVILFFGEVEPIGKGVAVVSALCMIVLAMTRQSLLLSDSEKLIQSELKVIEVNERYEYLANHDVLTDLPNRRLFQDRLTHAVSMAKTHQYELALLFVDVDRFKLVNDSLGHADGDLLLVKIVERVNSRLREQDTFARWGGDEFIVLLENIDSRTQAAVIAQSIIELFDEPFELSSKRKVSIGISAGISLFPLDAIDSSSLVRFADLAMYRAKDRGRNNHQFYTTELTVEAESRFILEGKIRNALKNADYELYYQPIMERKEGSETQKLIAAEALIRWKKSEQEIVMPSDFIACAEETGLINPLGKWVLEQACQQLASWDVQGYKQINLSVNISPVQLHDEHFVENVRNAMEMSGISENRLTLEITEGAIMRQEEDAVVILLALKALGVRISIDDFGVGHSSLAKLRHLPLDELKIDRVFVKDIPANKADMQIASAIIAMAKGLQLDVVAEGIETEAQLMFFAKQSCERYQGYLFSRPVSSEDFFSLLTSDAHLNDYQTV